MANETEQTRLQRLLDAAPDGMLVVGADGRIRLANTQAARLFGYERSELIGTPVDLLVPSALRERHRNHREGYLAEPHVRSMGADLALSGVRKDGVEFPVEISLSPFDSDGEVSVIAAVRDVTERRRSEARFRGLLESAPDAMVIADRDGHIVLVNSQTERMFGYKREELLGQTIEILVPEHLRERHVQHREGYSASPRPRPMGAGLALMGRRKEGSEFPVEISLSPMESEEGLLVSAAIRDITARKKAEAELERRAAELARSNEELERFAYVASHDLQEPLRMVTMYSQLLSEKYGQALGEEPREWIEFLVGGAQRMQALILDLLTFSRVSRQERKFEAVDLNDAVEHALENLRAAIEQTHATIDRDPLPTVLGDPSQLVQLFQNLLGNAVKFHRPNVPPVIHVSAQRTARFWNVSVSDNGAGVPMEFREKIFLPFQRLHGRDYPGTGMGLAICKRIVERHGGEIRVDTRPGEGATFSFTLRALDPSSA